MNVIKIKLLAVLLFCVSGILLSSCSEGDPDQNSVSDIENIPSVTPKLIHSIDQTGDLYFSHLGYESVVLNNGNIAFADREVPAIVIINEEGELQKEISSGRGPGEILDAYRFTKDANGNIYTYDQDNDKLIIYDKEFNLLREVIPPNYESTSLIKAYPTGQEDELLLKLTSFEYLRDENKDPENILIQYNTETEMYGEENKLKAHPYARLILDGQVRGSARVPYASGNITAYNSEAGTLFIFDTGTDIIAEINAQYDTLNTIPVNLPTEEISSAERDSIEASYNFSEQWKTVEELLPDAKAPADKMLYHQGEFWLKSNMEAETEIWMVVNANGEIDRLVHLPKESMLLHVSEEHLGLRLDDVTFALFKNSLP